MSNKKERNYEARRLFNKSFEELTLKQEIKVIDTIQKKPVGYLNKARRENVQFGIRIPTFRF